VEAIVLPVLGQVIEHRFADFLPYAFQILALMLDLTSNTSQHGISDLYSKLFTVLWAESLWQNPSNAPGLVRLLTAYFVKHNVFAAPLQGSMPAIFERLKFMLGHRDLETTACSLINALFRHLPLEFYQAYLQDAISVVLTRLQTKQAPYLEREFVVSLSLLIHLHSDVDFLPRLLNHLQPGLFRSFLERVWLQGASRVFAQHQRKVCVLGLAKLMNNQEVREDQALLTACCERLIILLSQRGPNLPGRAEDEEPVMGQEFQVAFNKLDHAEMPGASAAACGADLIPEIKNPNETRAAVQAALAPTLPWILRLGDAELTAMLAQ